MNCRYITIVISFLFSLNLNGQECNCPKNIQLIQQKVELNQASYQHQVVELNRKEEYNIFKNEINKISERIKSKRDCVGLISVYLNFFRDEHSFINYNEKSKIGEYQKKVKTKKKTSSSFGGLWYFQDGSFSIEVWSYETDLSQWVAVMRNDYTSRWKKGRIKIDFYQDKDLNLKCIYWNNNVVPKVYNVDVSDSCMSVGRYLKFYRSKPCAIQHNIGNTDGLAFKELTANTNYFRIPSFDLSQAYRIDSLIMANQGNIISKRNLIIDVRNNGGGGFDAFKSILPYVLTSEIVEQPYYGSVWVSKDNLEYYDNTKYEYAETKKDSLDEIEYIKFLRKYKNTFTPVEIQEYAVSLIKGFPNKIGIIFNRYTASSAEGFVLTTAPSEKVQTFGENSMGAVSYGDWMPIELPELNIWIAVTTKKMVFKHGGDFESIGISPDIDLSGHDENDWIDFALKNLEKE